MTTALVLTYALLSGTQSVPEFTYQCLTAGIEQHKELGNWFKCQYSKSSNGTIELACK